MDKLADNKKEDGFMSFINENRPAAYSLMGSITEMLKKPKERAAIENEISKTQYGYLLNQGIGDTSKVKRADVLGKALKGAMAGHVQDKNDEWNEDVFEAINKKPEVRTSANTPISNAPYANPTMSTPLLDSKEMMQAELPSPEFRENSLEPVTKYNAHTGLNDRTESSRTFDNINNIFSWANGKGELNSDQYTPEQLEEIGRQRQGKKDQMLASRGKYGF